MLLKITSAEALWFLPFVLPICLWVAWTDLSRMIIRNKAVITLAVIFLVIGLIALPFPEYPWRLATMAVVLVVGIVMNAAGLMGAGDAEVHRCWLHPLSIRAMLLCCASCLQPIFLACFTVHRIAKNSRLRDLAPHWESWSRGRKFPMGFSLGGTLAIYLFLGVIYGS